LLLYCLISVHVANIPLLFVFLYKIVSNKKADLNIRSRGPDKIPKNQIS